MVGFHGSMFDPQLPGKTRYMMFLQFCGIMSVFVMLFSLYIVLNRDTFPSIIADSELFTYGIAAISLALGFHLLRFVIISWKKSNLDEYKE